MQKSMKAQTENMHIEESVDALVKRLESKGKKIKILNDDEDDEK
jgi:hypothetical protein